MTLLLIIAATALSCSTDTSEFNDAQGKNSTQYNTARIYEMSPSNLVNQYDEAGRVHNKLLANYLNSTHATATLPSIVSAIEALAAQDTDFAALSTQSYVPITTGQAYLISQNNVQDVLTSGSLSSAGTSSIETFFNLMVSFQSQNENYPAIYEAITVYEDSVISNTGLNNSDKKIILTTTSIARYAAYYSRQDGKGKDKDWRLSVGNIVNASSGASEGMAKAVTMSLCNGLNNARLNQ